MTKILSSFFKNESSAGLTLILCTIISLILANSAIQVSYESIWNFSIGEHSLTHWINDGLMAIFFLLIGLELKREIFIGELTNIKKALLPIFAALGGMIVPALFYLSFNYGTPTQSGMGIPMATDIAFAIGVLTLLGSRVPISLKIFLTALAVIDDLGAIVIIALFYGSEMTWLNLIIAIGILIGLFVLNKMKVKNVYIYLIGGFVMWYFMLHSGVHATITGVLLAFAIPFDKDDSKSISFSLQNKLHYPVSFIILPLFALANTAITIQSGWESNLTEMYSLGILAGLVIGKPVGIFLFSFFVIKIGLCQLPDGVNWKRLLGAGILGGIGFTMSIFITLLAFEDENIINSAKVTILISSMLSAIVGFVWIKMHLPKKIS